MENVAALNIDVITGTVTPLPQGRDPGDDALWVTFEMTSHFNDALTRERGYAVFEMAEYIKVIVPGDATLMINRPVRETDKSRFPRQYQAFLVGKSQQLGTPLKGWPHITPAQADELAFFKILTVEQLAVVSDGNAQKYMGLNELRSKAKNYLEAEKSEAPFQRMNAELAGRDEKISTLQAELQQAMEAIAELRAAERGRSEREGAEDVPQRSSRRRPAEPEAA